MFQQEPSLEAVASTTIRASLNDVNDQVRVIEPGTISLKHLARDVWRSRELLYFLVWRDVSVRYKQTVMGVLWVVIQPIISMIVLSIVFGRLKGITQYTGGTPYPVFVYAGLLPWTLFANALSSSSVSVLYNSSLVTKIRFPRIALPIATTAGELVDFIVSFVVLLGLMLFYHVPITWRLLFLPFLTFGICLIAIGLGSIFASLTVKYRDFRFILPFLTQIWMFVTPVIYPIRLVPPEFRWFLVANPMSGWVGGFRAAILGYGVPRQPLAVACVVSVVIFLVGVYYFQSKERRFAEVI